MQVRVLTPEQIPWQKLDRYGDRTIFQSCAWIAFLAETQDARPVIAELRDGSEIAGYFTGLMFQRYGIRVLGSPFAGWSTPYIGFNLEPGVSRRAALAALQDFAFHQLKCLHLEVCDREFQPEDSTDLGFDSEDFLSYETDLTAPEEQLLLGMTKKERWAIRKAEKFGVTVEEASDERFAFEFYDQLIDVFGKHGLVPPYGVERVQALIRHLQPTGNLLLLRARGPNGSCIATDIHVGLNRVAYFWGNASYRSGLYYCPNQPLHWYAMRYFKARGASLFDWGGGGKHKRKFGAVPISIPRFRKSRFKVLGVVRTEAKKLFLAHQRLLTALPLLRPRHRTIPPEPAEIAGGE